jgi:hypothetical protein
MGCLSAITISVIIVNLRLDRKSRLQFIATLAQRKTSCALAFCAFRLARVARCIAAPVTPCRLN